MIFARIGSGPCYKHCNEICAGVKSNYVLQKKGNLAAKNSNEIMGIAAMGIRKSLK